MVMMLGLDTASDLSKFLHLSVPQFSLSTKRRCDSPCLSGLSCKSKPGLGIQQVLSKYWPPALLAVRRIWFEAQCCNLLAVWT